MGHVYFHAQVVSSSALCPSRGHPVAYQHPSRTYIYVIPRGPIGRSDSCPKHSKQFHFPHLNFSAFRLPSSDIERKREREVKKQKRTLHNPSQPTSTNTKKTPIDKYMTKATTTIFCLLMGTPRRAVLAFQTPLLTLTHTGTDHGGGQCRYLSLSIGAWDKTHNNFLEFRIKRKAKPTH